MREVERHHPPGPVAPGAKWTRTYEAPLPLLGTLRYDLALELATAEDARAETPYTVALARSAAPATATADPISASIEVDFGGGKGSGMVYVAGKPDHKMDNDRMVEHIVELVEKRAAEIEAAKAAEDLAAE